MGSTRFRQSKKIDPLRSSIAETGIGASAGVPGARVGGPSLGRVTKIVGTHGTGIHFRANKVTLRRKDNQAAPQATAAAATAPSAGATSGGDWYPDPCGDGELRYWDGHAWTAHVSTRGVVSHAPVPPAEVCMVALKGWFSRPALSDLLDQVAVAESGFTQAVASTDWDRLNRAAAAVADTIVRLLRGLRVAGSPPAEIAGEVDDLLRSFADEHKAMRKVATTRSETEATAALAPANVSTARRLLVRLGRPHPWTARCPRIEG